MNDLRNIKRAPNVLLKGQAGVWRVASMLALRGLNPHFPGVDHGYDLMIERGVRIQVKATQKRYDQPAYAEVGCYAFKLRRAAYARGNNTIVKTQPRIFSEQCDFVILWGIDEDRFWVVPASELDGVSFVVTGPNHVKYAARNDITKESILALRNQGWKYDDIAEHLGVNRYLVWKRLNKEGCEKPKVNSISARVRVCESRWDLIDQYLETFQQDALVGVEEQPLVEVAELA